MKQITLTKRMLAILMSIIMVLGMTPLAVITAFAAGSVSYVERSWDADTKTVKEEVKEIPDTAEALTATTTELGAGYYTVPGDLTLTSLSITDDAHLILTDGTTLTVSDHITIKSGSLSIYGQSEETGSLIVKQGIRLEGGPLTIHGGIVDVTGYVNVTAVHGGIGWENSSNAHLFTIYGGMLTANGDSGGGTAIGGERCNVLVYGGTVSTRARFVFKCRTGALTMNGGRVLSHTDAGMELERISVHGGVLNTGAIHTYNDVFVGGGMVNAQNDDGGDAIFVNGSLTIRGGTVVASGSSDFADIHAVEVIIEGGNVKLSNNKINAIIGVVKGISYADVSPVTIIVEGVADATPITSISGVKSYGLNDVVTLDTNKLYFWLPSDLAPTGTVNGTVYACVDGTVEGVYHLHLTHVNEDGDGSCDVCGRVFVPKFKIEDNILCVSYDEGVNYEPIGNVADGNGITEIKKTATNGNVDTYTIYYSDGSATTFTVTNGTNGADGKDGVTPLFRVENNVLYVSYDDGESWTSLGSVKGDKGDTGNGIASIEKTKTEGNVDTYTITYTDGTTTTFTVTNGKDGIDGINGTDGEDGHSPVITIQNGYWYIDGVNTNIRAEGLKGDTGNGISAIEKTGTNGLVDTYTITFTDGSTTTFTVTNGADGTDGAAGVGIEKVEKTGSEGNVDTYTITLTNGNTFTFTVTNGSSGSDGTNGKDGITPKLRINESTNMWEVSYDNGATWESLGISAVGSDGTHGSDGKDGADGKDGSDGQDGVTPLLRINDQNIWEVSYNNGNTWVSLGISAVGSAGADGTDGSDGRDGIDGKDGADGRDGADGKDGQDGVNGKDGVTPQLRINAETNEWEVSYDNGNTWTSLVVKATGENGKDGKDGKDGLTPFIGENGNWWIGDTDTGVQAAYDGSVPAGSGSVVENNGMNTATLIAIIIACLSLASNIVLVILYVNQKKKIRL